MKVAEVMHKSAYTVNLNTSFLEVWNLLFKKHTHALPVVDDSNILKGIIVIGDVLAKLYPSYSDTLEEIMIGTGFEDLEEKIDDVKKLKAKDIMSKRVMITFPDEPVLRAFSRMIVRRVRQLPVVDEEEKVIGMISKRDIFDKLLLRRTHTV